MRSCSRGARPTDVVGEQLDTMLLSPATCAFERSDQRRGALGVGRHLDLLSWGRSRTTTPRFAAERHHPQRTIVVPDADVAWPDTTPAGRIRRWPTTRRVRNAGPPNCRDRRLRAGERQARPRRADPRRRGREPEPRGRERRAARHRQGVRLVADHTRHDRGRLLARSRGVGALARRPRRPLRPQADAHPRRVRSRCPRACSPRTRRRDTRAHRSPASSAASRPAWPTPPRLR